MDDIPLEPTTLQRAHILDTLYAADITPSRKALWTHVPSAEPPVVETQAPTTPVEAASEDAGVAIWHSDMLEILDNMTWCHSHVRTFGLLAQSLVDNVKDDCTLCQLMNYPPPVAIETSMRLIVQYLKYSQQQVENLKVIAGPWAECQLHLSSTLTDIADKVTSIEDVLIEMLYPTVELDPDIDPDDLPYDGNPSATEEVRRISQGRLPGAGGYCSGSSSADDEEYPHSDSAIAQAKPMIKEEDSDDEEKDEVLLKEEEVDAPPSIPLPSGKVQPSQAPSLPVPDAQNATPGGAVNYSAGSGSSSHAAPHSSEQYEPIGVLVGWLAPTPLGSTRITTTRSSSAATEQADALLLA